MIRHRSTGCLRNSDSLQELHQIVLLRTAEIQLELPIVVIHQLDQRAKAPIWKTQPKQMPTVTRSGRTADTEPFEHPIRHAFAAAAFEGKGIGQDGVPLAVQRIGWLLES